MRPGMYPSFRIAAERVTVFLASSLVTLAVFGGGVYVLLMYTGLFMRVVVSTGLLSMIFVFWRGAGSTTGRIACGFYAVAAVRIVVSVLGVA